MEVIQGYTAANGRARILTHTTHLEIQQAQVPYCIALLFKFKTSLSLCHSTVSSCENPYESLREKSFFKNRHCFMPY